MAKFRRRFGTNWCRTGRITWRWRRRIEDRTRRSASVLKRPAGGCTVADFGARTRATIVKNRENIGEIEGRGMPASTLIPLLRAIRAAKLDVSHGPIFRLSGALGRSALPRR